MMLNSLTPYDRHYMHAVFEAHLSSCPLMNRVDENSDGSLMTLL